MNAVADPGARIPERPARPFILGTIVIALTASTICFAGSWRASLWVDEAYTVSVATRSVNDLWRMVQNIDIVHGLYNLSLHPWFAAFGVNEVTVRLPSTLAVGVATAGVCILARRLAKQDVWIWAGLVFALLPRVTWMGMEGRVYALTAVLAVWLTIVYVHLIRRPAVLLAVLYAVLGALAVSFNIFLVLLLGAHGVCALLDRTARFRRGFFWWFAAAVAALIGGLPVLLKAMSQSAQIGPTRLDFIGYVRNILVNQWFLGGTPTMFLPGGRVLDAPGLELWKPASVLLAAGCWLLVLAGLRTRAMLNEEQPDLRVVALSWLFVPSAILVAYAVLATPIYNPRYLTFATPALALLVGWGITSLRRGWPRFAALLLIVLLTTPVYLSQRTVHAKSGADWSQVAQFVGGRQGPNQGVYFAPRSSTFAETIGVTSRTASVIYPDQFRNLKDITIIATPAEDANLVGRSLPLAGATDRLAGLVSVFVIRRSDYAPSSVMADDLVFQRFGFAATDSWTGPLNTVVEFRR